MRRHGNLTRWNEDRGFGFITPAGSDTELFVHISAFPRGGARPIVGELVSFEVEKGPDGRERAVRIYRAGQAPPARKARPPAARPSNRNATTIGAMGLLLLITGGWAYTVWHGDAPAEPQTHAAPLPLLKRPKPPQFQCDGRIHCSQMTSCAEATYFIRNCPDTRMDGDRDGVPCESQHCPG